MAKRGQRYGWRVRYRWTTGIGGTSVASSFDEAEGKANRIAEAARRRDDADVIIHITTADSTTPIATIDTATEQE